MYSTQQINHIFRKTTAFSEGYKNNSFNEDWKNFENELYFHLSQIIPLVQDEAQRCASNTENELYHRFHLLKDNKIRLEQQLLNSKNELSRVQERERNWKNELEKQEQENAEQEKKCQLKNIETQRHKKYLTNIQKQRQEKTSDDIDELNKRYKELKKKYEEMEETITQMKEQQQSKEEEKAEDEVKQDKENLFSNSESNDQTQITQDSYSEFDENDEKGCNICAISTDLFSLKCCGTCICYECLDDWFRAGLNDVGLLPIKCPTCKTDDSVLFPTNMDYPSQLSFDERKKVEAKTIIKQRGLIPCIFPDCDAALELGENDISNAVCGHCNRMMCVKCKVPWSEHIDLSCEQYQEKQNQKKAENTLSKEELKRFGFKQCPKCGEGIEKNHGCNHITCTKCQANMCWMCEVQIQDVQEHFNANHPLFNESDVIYNTK